MREKQKLQMLADIAMAVLLPLLMAYSLIGEEVHEWLGAAILALFILHHALNYRWFPALLKGHYGAVRILNTAVNLLLLIDILMMGISGIVMSTYAFSFLGISKAASLAREIHLPGAYWGFLLMSFHIGLHWSVMSERILAILRRRTSKGAVALLRLLALLVSCYGVYTFIFLKFTDYLFLRTHFVFLPFDEPVIFYLGNITAVMVLFAVIGYYGTKLLSFVEQKTRKEVST